MKELIGFKVIKPFYDDESVYLFGKNALFQLYPETYYCAISFIHHINNADLLYDTEILNVEYLDLKTLPSKQDCLVEEWGYRIITIKGICTLEMRMESNGYYIGLLRRKKVTNIPANAKELKDF